MNKEDILTLKAVLLYIINHSEEDRCDVYSIVKTAYYAQQLHFVKWGLPLYNDKISALKFGPVPSTIYDILRLARGEERERAFLKKSGADKIAESIGFSNESFFANEAPDLDYLSQSNIECLNEAIDKVASMDFKEIVKDTHGKEWNRAYFHSEDKVMNNVKIAVEAGATEAAVEYLKDSLEFEKIFG